jgi:hypothetical protein
VNDPHIEALHYRVRHAAHIDYDKAGPLDHDTAGFTIRIQNGRAEVTMKSHHATVDAARAEVEPFLRAWELTAALEFGPGEFELAYQRAAIVDRNPPPQANINGVLHAEVGNFTSTATGTIHVGRSKYPDPPLGIARDADVDLMFDRVCRYRAGTTTLADAANLCLTVLQLTAGGRPAAARRYSIAKTVLNRLGDLAATKGGNEARKAKGAQVEFTAAEKRWLEETMKRLIRRASEVAGDPSALLPQITMADLPSLSGS